MKRILIFCLLGALLLPVFADNEKPIRINELPAKAQQLINTFFKTKKVALSKVESSLFDKSYDVIFTDGAKIEFSSSGEWNSIECKKDDVPTSLIPAAIQNYLKINFPNVTVKSIEKGSNSTEIDLSNDMSIKFDKNYKVVDIDND